MYTYMCIYIYICVYIYIYICMYVHNIHESGIKNSHRGSVLRPKKYLEIVSPEVITMENHRKNLGK